MASALGRPALVAPSDRSTIRAGGRLPLSSGEFSMAPIDAKIASPIAVCCWSWRLATALRTRSRWWVGGTSTCALPANATSPSRNRRGNESTNARTARCAALIRVGSTSVARIDCDTSTASITVAVSRGTWTARAGRANAMTMSTSASSRHAAARWRRHPGRVGATDARRSTLVKRTAYWRR